MNIKSPTSADIPNLRRLWQEAFGDTEEFLDLFFGSGFSPERCLFIEEEGTIAAVLYWFDCEWKGRKIAYIYAVATAKNQRGKGLCHKLMEHTHSHLKSTGYAGAILVPGSPSLFKFYESMGYTTSCFIHEFDCSAAKGRAKLKEISKEEFSTLRRHFLTENSVIQEGENLDFLSSYANFYAGEDFILAAYKDGSTLICPEILGNAESAPSIVSALGCEKGSFRTIGALKPFAMYLPLQEEDKTHPSYLGFAFD